MAITYSTLTKTQYDSIFVKLLQAEEGTILVPYVDSEGIVSIGAGVALRNGIVANDNVVPYILENVLKINRGASGTAELIHIFNSERPKDILGLGTGPSSEQLRIDINKWREKYAVTTPLTLSNTDVSNLIHIIQSAQDRQSTNSATSSRSL